VGLLAEQAMRFPLQAHKKELASADEAREREKEMAQVSALVLS
jgi:26S proteasome regulatory subunit N3